MSFIYRHFGALFMLALIAGLVLGISMASRSMTIDLGPIGTLAPPTPAPIVPVVQSSQTGGTATNGGQAFTRPTTGAVQKVEGKTITLTTAAGVTQRVAVSDTTTFVKSSTITAADLKAGDEVTVLGQDAADGSVAAQSVQVGAAGNLGNLALGARTASAGDQTGAATRSQGAQGATGGAGTGARAGNFGGQAGANFRTVTGSVQKVDGSALTIATGDGQTVKVTIGSNTRLRKSEPAALADVTAGEQISVQGQTGTDGVIAASVVQIGALR